MDDDINELKSLALQPDGKYLVDGDMLIGDAIMAFPKVAGIMLGFGLHCVGCHANIYDTIEGGAKGHGMSDEEIVKMIEEINTAINKRIETIEFTPRAIAKAKELRKLETGRENWPLRITVNGGDDGALSYELDFDEKKDGDLDFELDGLAIIIQPKSYDLFKGSSIDYVENSSASGFKIENPNAPGISDYF